MQNPDVYLHNYYGDTEIDFRTLFSFFKTIKLSKQGKAFDVDLYVEPTAEDALESLYSSWLEICSEEEIEAELMELAEPESDGCYSLDRDSVRYVENALSEKYGHREEIRDLAATFLKSSVFSYKL